MYHFRIVFIVLLGLFFFTGCLDTEQASTVENEENASQLIDDVFANFLETHPEARIISDKVSNRSVACEPTPAPGAFCQTIPVSDMISYNGSANCPGCNEVFVFYDVTVCINPLNFTVESVSFSDFNAQPGNCNDLWDCWFNMSSGQLSQEFEQFLSVTSQTAEDSYMESVVNIFGVECGNFAVEANFHRQLCYQTCLQLLSGPPFFRLELFHCGRKCCKRTRMHCLMPSGEVFTTDPVYESVGGDSCLDNPTNSCDGLGTPCFDAPCGTF